METNTFYKLEYYNIMFLNSRLLDSYINIFI